MTWILDKTLTIDGKELALATVEIKTRISASSQNEVVHRGGGTVYAGEWDFPTI